MEYDYRNRATSPYDPPYRTSTSPYGQSLYPRVAQSQPQPGQPLFPPSGSVSRNHPSFHPPSSSSSSSSGIGIRVTLKPEYRIAPPPQLSPLVGNIPRSNFQFDFDFERKILAEAEKDTQNWSKLISMEHLPLKSTESSSSTSSVGDPVVAKYVASGLNREAVTLAVANYGNNPSKVQEFVNGFNLLREMGFSSNKVAEALLMYDNDTDKAVAHFLGSSA